MSKLHVIMNGQRLEVEAGTTVLDAARAARIDIPTLCHHPALKDMGACRMCLVEVSNSPALQPACTFPVMDGLEVQTETERTTEMRKFVLEMLFSERNHYCMFCEMSGDCELQALAYRYGLDHWTYPTPNPKLPVDASRTYFLMDHNRCILCRRCIRACGEVAANHTLGVMSRGTKTLVTADMDEPFGASSCVSCGTCLQVCPTGALVDRRSAYMGRHTQTDTVASSCALCSVGCAINVVSRNGRPLRVEGAWDGPNQGVLCVVGRFESLDGGRRERITTPMVRTGGKLERVSWDDAMGRIAWAMRAARPGGVKAWTTGRMLSEPMDALEETFRGKIGGEVRTLEVMPSNGPAPSGGRLADIDNADAILVAGLDPLGDHRVVGYRIRRAVDRDVPLIVCGDGMNQLAPFAKMALPLSKIREACEQLAGAERPVIVYRAALPAEAREALARVERGIFLPLYPAANTPHAMELDFASGPTKEPFDVAYILLGDTPLDERTRAEARKATFVVLHASYMDEAADIAHVVLPAPLWYEREGTFRNMEDRDCAVAPAVPMPEGLWPEERVFEELAERM